MDIQITKYNVLRFIPLRKIILIFIFSISLVSCKAQTLDSTTLGTKIDSLLQTESNRPFNGIILVSQKDSIIYSKMYGFSNIDEKVAFKESDQFVIGSLSKQITAVLILQTFERNELKLEDPLGKFLPELTMPWKDSVTVHHLLNHTHGIEDLGVPLKFSVGTDFEYSNLGYQFLAQILEKTSKKSFPNLLSEFFENNNLRHSAHPSINQHWNLIDGHDRNDSGEINTASFYFNNLSAASGTMISNSSDMQLWNELLHGKKLLNKETYGLMTTASATQNHSLFGEVGYGYGIRISKSQNIKEIGHTGYIPGFISMNFYYPETETSLIVLENLDWQDEAIKNTFLFELEIREIVRNSLKNQNY